ERRRAVAARLSDPSIGVRRAAFRASCALLQPGLSPEVLTGQAAELLRRVRDEAPHVREQVLGALERTLLPQPLAQASLGLLVDVVRQPGVGSQGLRDVLAAHCAAAVAARSSGQEASKPQAGAAKAEASLLALATGAFRGVKVISAQSSAAAQSPELDVAAAIETALDVEAMAPWTLILEQI
ncbi:unnamed protein product, partial [Polarella glacialis]